MTLIEKAELSQVLSRPEDGNDVADSGAEARGKFLRSRVLRDGQAVRFQWYHTSVFLILHILAVVAFLPMFISWSSLGVFLAMCWITGAWGVTLGYHRLLTHRSFATYKWVEYMLTLFACLSWQGGPIKWVGTHRLHHAQSDLPGDPHSPKDGFCWSHVFWILHSARPDEDPYSVTKDLQKDPVMMFFDKYWYVPQFFAAALLFGLGWWLMGSLAIGFAWVLWGICLRTVVMYHATWFVNSAAHTWGYRNFETEDDSRNNWWVALVSFGEGWHNNHHAQPRSAAHGMRWFEFDITYWTILTMRTIGLAWKVVSPKPPGAAE